MEIKAAIFDVDGTIIKGNCTEILINYLLEHDLLHHSSLEQYNKVYRSYLATGSEFVLVIKEAFKLLSALGKEERLRHSKECFHERIRHKIQKSVWDRINVLKSEGLEIILASGSPMELISPVALYLGIPEKNIIASCLDEVNIEEINGEEGTICHGKVKHRLVKELLSKKVIEACFAACFTDNLSDFDMLRAAGEGYWLGSEDLYSKLSMSNLGIQHFYATGVIITPGLGERLAKNDALYEYYTEKKDLLKNCFRDIIPSVCTEEAMEQLTGQSNLPWDHDTMQRVFFNPLYEYLNKRDPYIYNLGYCLFLEAGGLDPEKFRPLIAIGELWDVSYEMFEDIVHWTSPGKTSEEPKSHIDISITGNVSIALLSLVSHNLLFNRLDMDEEKQLHLLEKFTSLGFNALFGNGMKLFWKQQKEINISLDDYEKVAKWINMDKLLAPGCLWMLLGSGNDSAEVSQLFHLFVEDASVAIQLQNDLHTFNRWSQDEGENDRNNFDINTNYLSIWSTIVDRNPSLFSGNDDKSRVVEKILQHKAVEHLKERAAELEGRAEEALEKLPLNSKYKNLVRAYTNILPYA